MAVELRSDGRDHGKMRTIRVTHGVFEYAPGSVLFELGKTKVLCSVSLQGQVPQFMRGKNSGWLTAEYSLLPLSTRVRTPRENSQQQRNGRIVEISRFIGRALRSIVDLSLIGERTIIVDCDVLQADGGTRVAAITGACLALQMAQKVWIASKIFSAPIVKEYACGVSVGVLNGMMRVDPDQDEDNLLEADFNFVITQSGKLIEILGGAERAPIAWELFDEIRVAACRAAANIFGTIFSSEVQQIQSEIVKPVLNQETHVTQKQVKKKLPTKTAVTKKKISDKVPLFSLQNRFAQKEQ